MMEIQDIKDLMEKMSETGLTVLEFEAEGTRLRLEKTAPHFEVVQPAFDQQNLWHMPQAQGAPAMAATAPAAAAAETAEPVKEEKPGMIVTSPVVGVFYTAPTPESDPFVMVGSPVEVGSPLCIIEAMKLMNEVTSAWDGVVLEIMVENGQRVEYGQPLMRIGGN